MSPPVDPTGGWRGPRGPGLVGGLAAAAAALVLVAPWLRPGDLLVRDLVAVPDPGWSTLLLSPLALPREVPGEVVAALLGQVVPGGLVVRLAVVAALVALGAGAGRLAAGSSAGGRIAEGRVAAAVAGAVVVWNPFVLARLQQGQWLVVVALAAVPWVVVHLTDRDLPRLLRTLAVAATTGFLVVVVVVPTLVVGGLALRRWRLVGAGLAALGVLSLPWLVVTGPVVADPDGFAAFAPNADLAAGVVPSLVAGGGHFNTAVASPWRAGWVVTAIALALTAVAVWGVRRWGGVAGPARTVLVTSAVAGLAGAILAATGPGRSLLVAVSDVVPAVAVVRDAQRLLAPWVVLLGVGAGAAAAAVGRRAGAATATGVAMLLLAVVSLPDPLLGPRLPGPVELPAAWREAAVTIEAAAPRAVLVVPQGPTQRYGFTGGRPVHVPLQRLVGVPVLTGGRLVVRDTDGSLLVIDDGTTDAGVEALAAAWPQDVDGDALAAAGIGWVAVTDPGLMVSAPPPGTSFTVTSPTLQLARVERDVAPPVTPRWVLLVDVAAAALAVVLVAGADVWARRARFSHGEQDAAPPRR